MAVFLSTYVNKVDKKGRVSIPAQFRTALAKSDPPNIVYIWPSLNQPALEGAGQDYVDLLSESLEAPDLDADERETIETFVFGKMVQLTIDNDGRIVLPRDLADFAGVSEDAAFMGRRKTFQIWDNAALKAHEEALRDQAARKGISLSGIVAKAQRSGRGGEGA